MRAANALENRLTRAFATVQKYFVVAQIEKRNFSPQHPPPPKKKKKQMQKIHNIVSSILSKFSFYLFLIFSRVLHRVIIVNSITSSNGGHSGTNFF